MPYINQSAKERLIDPCQKPHTPGELNYLITRLLLEYLGSDITYSRLNELVGVLECCKAEFIERRLRPYERHKALVNGDVYS